tara:strand:- start:3705 stop:4568 length:864 start_codon:yes stop_codon:yes gene_type:complete
MLVDRYQVKIPRIDSSATTINVPIDLTPQMVDQSEIVNREFVSVEVDNAINPTLDYEKVRFLPASVSPNAAATTVSNPVIMQQVIYIVSLLDSTTGTYFSSTSYADAGFSDDDLRYRKNKLTKSFLQLSFYDSDILTDQRLVGSMAINPNITLADIQPNSTLYPVALKPLEFRLRNPLTDDEAFGEGFFVYHFKDEVDINLPEFLYMRATFNNAKTGVATGLMVDNTNIPAIDELVDLLHTRYVLHRTVTGYYYAIDDEFGVTLPAINNVTYNSTTVTVNLYAVRVS